MTELLTVRLHAAGPARGPARRPRRPAWSGSSSSSAGCRSSATGWATSPWPVSPSALLTGAAPVLTALVAAVAAAVVDRAAPRPGPHQRRRRPRRASSTAASPPASSSSASRPSGTPANLTHTSSAPSPRRSRGDLWVFAVLAVARRPSPPGRCARACSRWPTTRSTPAAMGMPVLAAQHRPGGPHRRDRRRVDAGRRPAAHQRADDRAQRRGAAARLVVPRRRCAGPSLIGLRAPRRRRRRLLRGRHPVRRHHRRSSPSLVFVAASVGRAVVTRVRARQHERGRDPRARARAGVRPPGGGARRPRRLPPRRPPPRPARGPLRRARRGHATAGEPPHQAGDPGRSEKARPAVTGTDEASSAADPAAGGRGRRCSAAADDFTSAQDLHARLRTEGHKVGLATVYRALQTLADQGQVDVLRTDDGEAVYRRCSTGAHHHHLVCRSCGRTVEVEGPDGRALGRRGERRARLPRRHATRWRSSAPAPTARTDTPLRRGSDPPRLAERPTSVVIRRG